MFTVDGAAAWVTDLALAKIGTPVYFVYLFDERPTVCGKVIRLGDRIRLVELPQGHTVDRHAYVTLERPSGYVEPLPQSRSE